MRAPSDLRRCCRVLLTWRARHGVYHARMRRFAWVGHFAFEKNRPAAFKHPLWSLRGDFRMHRLSLLGQMGPHDALAHKLYGAKAA